MMCTMPCAQQNRRESSSSCTIACAACQSLFSRWETACLRSLCEFTFDMKSIHPRSRDCDELAHLLGFGGDEGREVLGRIGHHGEAELLQPLADLRLAQRLGDLGIELLHYRPWGGRGHGESVPHA